MMPKIYIKTYGCQMNERDSETVAVLLQRHGYALTHDESEADVVIVNTCSVRAKAEEKALGKLGLLVASKREHPDRIVGAIGCMVQRMGHELLRKTRGLDFAVGPYQLAQIPTVLEAVRTGRRPVIDVREEDGYPDQDSHGSGGVSAFVNILFGCDRRCAYCIVPQVRGREWSRPAPEIIDETRRLVCNGVKEVTLLGQSIMSYGRSNPIWDKEHRSPRDFTEALPQLLEALNDMPGLERIRFTSGHPSGCTSELIRAMVELPSVCEHLHLPVQSGSDRILSRMNRGYTTHDYRRVARRLREALPGVTITTDIIVGFPSETMEDFEMTRALTAEIGFDNAFIFKYNPRPDTPAARWADDVPEAEKLRRNHVLLEDQNRQSLKQNQGWVGREVKVLVEGQSKRNPARWSGRTRTNKIVVFESMPGVRCGDLMTVAIDRVKVQTLYGTILGRQ